MTIPSLATLRIPPVLAELNTLAAFIDTFAEQQALSPSDTFSVSVAVEELFTNTVHHSQPPATWACLSLRATAEAVTAVYSDDGAPFDPTQQPAPDTTLAVEERSAGGLGIEILRRTMQSFVYERNAEGNQTTLVRARSE